MTTSKATIFVGGPFSSGLQFRDGAISGFDPQLREKLELVHDTVEATGARVLSSHREEKFGQDVHEESLVKRDNAYLTLSDAYVALLPMDTANTPYRSDGTCVEIGLAIGLRKPVILIMENPNQQDWSYYVRNLDSEERVTIIAFDDFAREPEASLRRVLKQHGVESIDPNHRKREDISDVESFLWSLRSMTENEVVNAAGMELVVMPGVFNPAYSRSSEFLMDTWNVQPGTRVLDMGSGSGILGIGALREGVAHLTAADINPIAVENTRENLKRLGLEQKAEVVQSDAYSNVSGRFDAIVSNPPFWNRKASDSIERTCFDDNHQFLRTLIEQAGEHARPGCQFFLVFSDQGDFSLIIQLFQRNDWKIEHLHLFRPTTPGGHIRMAWHAKRW